VAFARVLIEVEAGFEFEKEVQIRSPDGEIAMQTVEYEYIPPYCKNCVCFRHILTDCPIKFIEKWEPKLKQTEITSNDIQDTADQLVTNNNNNNNTGEGTENITVEDQIINTSEDPDQTQENSDPVDSAKTPSDILPDITGDNNDTPIQDINNTNTMPVTIADNRPSVVSVQNNNGEAASILLIQDSVYNDKFNKNTVTGSSSIVIVSDLKATASSTTVSAMPSSSECETNRGFLKNNNIQLNVLHITNIHFPTTVSLTNVSLNSQVPEVTKEATVESAKASQSRVIPSYPSCNPQDLGPILNLTEHNPEFDPAMADKKLKAVQQEKKKKKMIQDSDTPTRITRRNHLVINQ